MVCQLRGDISQNEDVSFNHDDVTVDCEDVTLNREDVTFTREDVTFTRDDVTLNREDVTLNRDDVTADCEGVPFTRDYLRHQVHPTAKNALFNTFLINIRPQKTEVHGHF